MSRIATSTEHEVVQALEARLESQRTSTMIQLGALAAAVVCIALAALLQTPINTQRKDLQLVMQSNIYKELPPEYAWVSAAGGAFRGIAADYLWMRADKLKEEGKYYEAHQLAKWICLLYPRFPAVWSFQAWNMSYNISVATHTALERWQWVYNGIRLLRDEGIPNNERVVPLYHQLAWTWFHKVGDRMDDFHWVYKRAWAATIETLLGAPPAGAPNNVTIDWFRPVAEAPPVGELVASKPEVAELVSRLKGLGIDVDASTNSQRLFHPLEETLFKPYTIWQKNAQLAALRAKPPEETEGQRKLDEFFASASGDAWNALLASLRAKVLREQYKMDPKFMLEMTGKFGTDEPIPIDWRTPWSQSMYWAMYGTQKGSEAKNVKEFDLLNTDRIMLFSLATLSKAGRYVFRIDPQFPMDSFLNTLPDLRYIDAMHRKYLELGKKHAEEGENVGMTAGETLRSGHVNNLHAAIVALYFAGQEQKAQYYLEYLAANYKDMVTQQIQEQYLQSVDVFVQSQLKEMAGSFNDASLLIYSLLTNGYLALSSGSADEFASAVQKAKLVYDFYQKDKVDDPQGRRAMPPFARVRANALADFLLTPDFPIPLRSMVWRSEQPDIRQMAYDDVIGGLAEQCREEGFDVEKAFPTPPGMAEYRRANPRPTQVEDVARQKQREQQEAKQRQQ